MSAIQPSSLSEQSSSPTVLSSLSTTNACIRQNGAEVPVRYIEPHSLIWCLAQFGQIQKPNKKLRAIPLTLQSFSVSPKPSVVCVIASCQGAQYVLRFNEFTD
ncbi:hypothetical protein AVEN_94986-1 [Araneus ventricosus]|uniref:Uncharacterized protein n=1 Tax=Araneus ventricosus TaxID=182803 RepID=A0A4Y2R5U8_ARAVE|nr:hypothetical protein AVEN_94986-1 [Araneus ventricosus]